MSSSPASSRSSTRRRRIATEYREHEARLKQVQHLLWFSKQQDAATARERHAGAIASLTVAFEAVQADVRAAEARQEALRADHYAAGDALHEKQGAYYEANAEVTRLEQQLTFARESETRISQQAAQLTEQLGALSGQEAALADERKAARGRPRGGAGRARSGGHRRAGGGRRTACGRRVAAAGRSGGGRALRTDRAGGAGDPRRSRRAASITPTRLRSSPSGASASKPSSSRWPRR